MAKRRVACPECGHKYTITIDEKKVTRTRFRATPRTGGGFNFEITADPEQVEADSFTNVGTDMLLATVFGLGFGVFCGICAYPIAPDYVGGVMGITASGGATFAYGILCAEYNTRLKRFAPWAARQARELQSGLRTAKESGVNLTVDHRYRDGHTEAGRTINYFGTLPVAVERFNEWAKRVLAGDSLAIGEWTPLKKGFSRGEYESLLNILQRAGCVTPLPGKGNVLTGGGRRALTRHLQQEAERPHPPAPPAERV